MQIDEKYFKQSDIDNSLEGVLEADEKILHRCKPDKRAYMWSAALKMLPVAVIWLCIDVTFLTLIGIEIKQGNLPIAMLAVLVPFFLVHLAPVWMWVTKLVKSSVEIKNIEYAFTDKRIIVRSGVIGIDFKFFYYDKIESVVAKVGLIDKLCKVGDIYITAAGTAGVIFDQASPYQLATKLQKIASDARADMYYPNELRPGGDGRPYPAANAFENECEKSDQLVDVPAWENAPMSASNDKSQDE